MVPKSHPELLRIFHSRNQKYWHGRLPEPLIFYMHITEYKGSVCFGQITKPGEQFQIAIDPQWSFARCVKHSAVVHELVHMELWEETQSHGAKFQARMLSLAQAGAFRNIW